MTRVRPCREALMSVLETFVHDPLVEWTKQSRGPGGGAVAVAGVGGRGRGDVEGAEAMVGRCSLNSG